MLLVLNEEECDVGGMMVWSEGEGWEASETQNFLSVCCSGSLPSLAILGVKEAVLVVKGKSS